MTIYYGRFLEAEEYICTGGAYYEYFNSIEAIYKYRDFIRSMGKFDILEKIGEMEFAKTGHLIMKEGTEKIVYTPEGVDNMDDDDGNDDDNE